MILFLRIILDLFPTQLLREKTIIIATKREKSPQMLEYCREDAAASVGIGCWAGTTVYFSRLTADLECFWKLLISVTSPVW